MPISPTGVVVYTANFTTGGTVAGFDINVSGYGENVPANFTARPIPWSSPGTYQIVVQSGGNSPISRTYQVTVYNEQDYGALRSLVGQQGFLTTAREGSPGPRQPQPAILTGVRRSNYQYPAWPAPGVGDGRDLQTLQVDFVMLSG